MGGADPDKVEVSQYPGQPKGESPGDHDAQVGERQYRQHRQADGDGLEEHACTCYYSAKSEQDKHQQNVFAEKIEEAKGSLHYFPESGTKIQKKNKAFKVQY